MLKFKEFVEFLNESTFKSKAAMQATFAEAYAKTFPNEMKPSGTKSGEAIRANFGSDPEQNIQKLFSELDIPIQTIIFHPKKTIRNEKVLGSDDYDTYEIITTDNETYYITNRNEDVGRKDLTPKNLNLEGPYTNGKAFSELVVREIDNLKWINSDIREFMKYLVEITSKSKFSQKYNKMKDFFEVSTHNETINFDKDFEFDDKVIKNLTNDFGEVLDGVYLSTIIKDLGEGVYFPTAANELLQDLVVDTWSVSSKAAVGGGRPSIDGLVQKCKAFEEGNDKNGLEESDPNLRNFLEIFKRLADDDMRRSSKLKTIETYTLLGQKFTEYNILHTDSCFNYLIQTANELRMNNFGIGKNPISREELCELMVNISKEGKWESFIKEYLNKTGTVPKKDIPTSEEVSTLQGANKKIGIIAYPLSKEIVKILNEDYSQLLTELVNKVLNVKQMYLSIDIKKDNISFRSATSDKIKKVTFEVRGSTNNFNQGLGFKMS